MYILEGSSYLFHYDSDGQLMNAVKIGYGYQKQFVDNDQGLLQISMRSGGTVEIYTLSKDINTVQSKTVIELEDDKSVFGVDVATYSDGRLLVSWQTSTSNDYRFDYKAQIFSPSGAPVSPVYQLDGATTGGTYWAGVNIDGDVATFTWFNYGTYSQTLSAQGNLSEVSYLGFDQTDDYAVLDSGYVALVGGGEGGSLRVISEADKTIVLTAYQAGDVINGSAASEAIYGRGGDNELYGKGGDDVIIADLGESLLYGGFGDDYLRGAGQLMGDAGNDTLQGISNVFGGSLLDGGAGNDYLRSGTSPAQPDPTTLMGGAGDDTLWSGREDGDDILYGGDGADVFSITDFYSGNDIIKDFEVGIDSIHFERLPGTLFQDGPNTVFILAEGYVLREMSIAIENVSVFDLLDFFFNENPYALEGTTVLSASADNYNDTDDGLFINAGPGRDKVDAAGGADTVWGGADNDTILGGEGQDRLFGDDGNDDLNGGEDDDLLFGNRGSDTIRGDEGDDKIWAGKNDDDGDTFYGDAGNDKIGGGIGRDAISGGTGRDTLLGGDDADTLWGGDRDSQSDTTADIIWAGTGSDLIFGAAGSDTLGGGLDGDGIRAGAGNDVLYGGKGEANDTLSGQDGDDVLFGGGGGDDLSGGNGSDLLYNGSGDDATDGGAGNDTLWGSPGDDTLTGGAGSDTFAFATGNGHDVITDFKDSDDTLDISELDITDLTALKLLASESGGDLLLDITVDQSIRLEGLSVSDLDGMSILF
ncbi:hypothetical protein GCM10017044_28760 [Kordiimonas sediminis]|uniref:Calcium-binding protein n=1 Tax=Kordiimonas sediminis TaxID=1735581 RepID=A0A919B086_9PROT|nr:calcium-binding protein [Kordiimonas sediminis]GHF31926.1 hypothetical protein GCM10017044_28760 [Kordiimonas sediminis]